MRRALQPEFLLALSERAQALFRPEIRTSSLVIGNKRILDAANGVVTVESTPGNGATFTITLPRNGSGSVDPSIGSESEDAVVADSDPLVH